MPDFRSGEGCSIHPHATPPPTKSGGSNINNMKKSILPYLLGMCIGVLFNLPFLRSIDTETKVLFAWVMVVCIAACILMLRDKDFLNQK